MKAITCCVSLLVVLSSAAACSPSVNLEAAVRVDVLTTGWADVSPPSGLYKIVPSISLQVRNTSDRELGTLQLNAVFRHQAPAGALAAEFGSGFVPKVGPGGLGASAISSPLRLESDRGYTGQDTAEELLANSHFEDAVVDVYAKFGSSQWTRLGEYPVARTILAR